MKPFPGKLERSRGKLRRLVLNDEQRGWLRRWFPTTENKRLARAMGVSESKLRAFAHALGLAKSEAGLKAIQRRTTAKIVKANRANGCYERKHGHAPSQATMDGLRRRWEDIRQGLREHPSAILKRKDPERYRASMERRSQERRESIRKEKLRVLYGLERRTRLKTVVLCPYKRSQLSHRYSALKRGYLLDEDCSEGSPGRYVIYYDDETQRSERFERNCIKDGFRFERDLPPTESRWTQ